MENNNWLQYKIDIIEIKAFSLRILSLSEKIPVTTRGKVINYQITKSGTSMYANYRAALRSRSKAGFFSKLSIVAEEADETEMWLKLFIASGMLTGDSVKTIHDESIELLKLLSTMRKKLSSPCQSIANPFNLQSISCQSHVRHLSLRHRRKACRQNA